MTNKKWILSDEELTIKMYNLREDGLNIERYRKEWDAARHKLTAHRRQDTPTDRRTISGIRFGGE